LNRSQELPDGAIADSPAMFDAFRYGSAKMDAHVDTRKPVFHCGVGEAYV
jgi:hypothetical protein